MHRKAKIHMDTHTVHKQTEAHLPQPICAVVRFRSDTELHLTSAIGFQLSK